jgi:hypothetical protein
MPSAGKLDACWNGKVCERQLPAATTCSFIVAAVPDARLCAGRVINMQGCILLQFPAVQPALPRPFQTTGGRTQGGNAMLGYSLPCLFFWQCVQCFQQCGMSSVCGEGNGNASIS